MVIPCDLLILQNLRDLHVAPQVHALTECHHNLLLLNARVADIVRLIGHVLQQSQLIRTTGVVLLVPAAVRILYTPIAIVVPAIAHRQLDLFDPMVSGDEQGALRWTDLHHLDRLVLSNFKDVQQFRLRLSVAMVLHDLVNASIVRSHVVDDEFLVQEVHLDSV